MSVFTFCLCMQYVLLLVRVCSEAAVGALMSLLIGGDDDDLRQFVFECSTVY